MLHIEEIFFNFSHEQYGVSTLIRPCRGIRYGQTETGKTCSFLPNERAYKLECNTLIISFL